MVTTQETDQNPRARKGGKDGGPVAKVKFGSATVPIYRTTSGGRTRYVISYHRDGKRLPQIFSDLPTAKKEAQFVAQRIQSGMQQVTDIKPHERESYVAAVGLLEKSGIPLAAAVEDSGSASSPRRASGRTPSPMTAGPGQ